MEITLGQAAEACGGVLAGADPGTVARAVTTDSRNVPEGGLFVPLRGARADGHDFIPQALANGAVCALTERAPAGPGPYIRVKSCVQALLDLAAYYRSLLRPRVVAVTGSVGKTTTKDMIASVVSQRYHTLKTMGNFNNEIGLPLTIFQLEPTHEAAVLEMGMNHKGEIHNLSRVARPDIAVITNIGVAHIENLGSRQGILEAKTEIFDYMEPTGLAILNGDDDMLAACRPNCKVLYYGLSDSMEVYADKIEDRGLRGSRCRLHLGDTVIDAAINVPGRHMVYNALAAAAAGQALGLTPEEICRGIETFVPTGMRMRILDAPGGLTVINDVYNANPVSMMAAIDVLCTHAGRKVAILGDMFELGGQAPALHRQVGRYAAEKGVDLLITAGTLAYDIYAGAREGGIAAARYFAGQEEMIGALRGFLQPGDCVLVKASRGMRFEMTVAALSGEAAEA